MVSTDTILNQDPLHQNATGLLAEIEWFAKVVETRIKIHHGEIDASHSIYSIAPPQHPLVNGSVFGEFINFYQLTFAERIVLMLALLPHVYPQALDVFFTGNVNAGKGLAAFGGIKGISFSGFLPTGETVLFLLAGNDLGKRFKVRQLFDAGHLFSIHHIVWLAPPPANEPIFCGQLLINDEYTDLFTGGQLRKPAFGMDFPAKKINTTLAWDDLVLDAQTKRQLDDIKTWLVHGQTFMAGWEMKKRVKPGYKALFFGPPGTGKTLPQACWAVWQKPMCTGWTYPW